jgi:hypothetical protein
METIRRPTLEDCIVDHETFSTLDLPQKRSILHPWLGEQTIVLIHGWRGIGKTWFGMGLLDAITRGISFGPRRRDGSTGRQGTV